MAARSRATAAASGADSTLLAQAAAAYRLCEVSPEQAKNSALVVIDAAGDDGAPAILAMRALSLAVRVLEGPNAAARVLREAIRLGERVGPARSLAEARITYAGILADRGHIAAALAECDRAAKSVPAKNSGFLLGQRALILSRAGRADEALADYARALPLLRASNDVEITCRTYQNRANVFAYAGRLREAERDLRTGIALAQRHGLDDAVVYMTENLGFLAVRRGDIPAALRLFAHATESRQPYVRFTGTFDRAEALLLAGLAGEARESLETLLDDVVNAGFAVDAAEWQLMLAQAALLEGKAQPASDFAEKALAQFRAQRRPGWALLARHLVIRARWFAGDRTSDLARAARDAHAKLWTAGWQVAALHCLLVAGRVELERGRLPAARNDLARAAHARRRGPADLRAAAWYAEALLRLATDDKRGATAALKAGLRVVDEHAATFGATDLRVHASGLGADLAGHGVRLAVESGKASAVLEWIERYRAGALRQRPVLPPSDAKLADDLAELRRVTAELAQATASGTDSRALRAQQMRLEEAVRQRSRHASGRRAAPSAFNLGELTATLGERALVEILRVDDAVLAVTAVNSRLRLHSLGDYRDALKELESLRFSVHRLARQHGSATSLAAAEAALAYAARNLDALLLDPLAAVVGDRELVIVPTGSLHALPWATLPSLRGRPFSVAPSATTWLAAARAAARPVTARARIALVAGPQLDHALPEVRSLARLYPTPAVLVGSDARADAVRSVLDGAELAHIAAHGHFRADNPQFSAIELADGPLTVYDLERVRRAPRRLVLSACDSGLSAVRPGDELMGLAGAVFSLGTSTLIASVAPVADDATKALMLELHRELCAGWAPAHALAAARSRVRGDGFVCFGAG